MIRNDVVIKVLFYDRKAPVVKGITGFREATIVLPKEATEFEDKEKRILVLEQLSYLLKYPSWKICFGCLNNIKCSGECPIFLLSSKILK